ncbi:MAG: lipopolysaccharide biosynthesis protein [Gemmataceae bacterium]
MISFAVPLLPCGICVFIMHHGDRFFLLRNVSSSDIGIYSLGYKLGMVAKLLSLTPLYMVWSSRMYSVARNPEAAITFGRNITNILVAYMFVSLPLSLFAREVILVMGGGQQYVAAAAMVAPVVLACFFQSAATLMDAGFYLKRQMPLKMKLTLFCTGIIVLCYSLMIPLWGIWGALAATVIGFGCLALQTFLVAQKIFPITFEWDRVAGYLGLAVGLWATGHCLPTGGLWIPAKVFVVLLFPFLSWHFGFVREDEKVEVGNALARILSQMQNWIRAGEKKPTPIELP